MHRRIGRRQALGNTDISIITSFLAMGRHGYATPDPPLANAKRMAPIAKAKT